MAATINTERGQTVAKLTKVRTSFNPGEVIKVGPEEYTDLSRQGLIHSDELGSTKIEWADEKIEEPTEVEPAATKKAGK